MIEDLKRSGLSPEDGPFTPLTAQMAQSIGAPKRPGYLIAYPGADFYRIRFTDGKAPRYWQPPGTGVRWFVPEGVSLRALSPLIITEGEKKALALTKAGLPAVGLGGVASWRSVSDLSTLEATGRVIVLLYDGDYHTNHMIRAAAEGLAAELIPRGAKIRVRSVPAPHKGADDWLVSVGAVEVSKTVAGWLRETSTIDDLNMRMIFVEETSEVFSVEERRFFPLRSWRTRTANENIFSTGGKPVPAFDYFISHPGRRTVRRLTYIPGQGHPPGEFNLWSGFGVEPKAGDVTPWLGYLAYAFPDPEARRWVCSWMAHLFQKPSVKQSTALVLTGSEGVGKSFLGGQLRSLVGAINCAQLNELDFGGRFTSSWSLKHLIIGEEITGIDSRRQMDVIKTIITQHEQRIEEKFAPVWTAPDYRNYIFISNHALPLLLGEGDRRFFVWRYPSITPGPQFFRQIWDWWTNEDGASKTLNYLLSYEVDQFDPHARAPMTDEKRSLQTESRTDFELFVKGLAASEKVAPVWSAADLMTAFDPMGRNRISSRAVFGVIRTILSGVTSPQTWVGERNVILCSLAPLAPDGRPFTSLSSGEWADLYMTHPPRLDGQAGGRLNYGRGT